MGGHGRRQESSMCDNGPSAPGTCKFLEHTGFFAGIRESRQKAPFSFYVICCKQEGEHIQPPHLVLEDLAEIGRRRVTPMPCPLLSFQVHENSPYADASGDMPSNPVPLWSHQRTLRPRQG